MALPKGISGNPNGRPKGSLNKVTKVSREWIANLLDKNRGQIEKDLQALEPFQRLQMLEKFMQYSMPKLSASKISIHELSEQHLDILINETIQSIEYGN